MRAVLQAQSPGYVANLANGLPAWLKFQRASASTVWTPASAVFTTLGNDVPAIDFDPVTGNPLGIAIYGQVTNQIRNSTVQGAANGTPGTNPTNWTVTVAGNGLQRSVTLTTVNGIAGIAYRVWGTTTAAATFFINPELPNGIVASNGQTWTQSGYLAITSGSLGAATFSVSILALDSGQTGLAVVGGSIFTPAASLTRYTNTGTISAGTTAYIQPRWRIDYANGITFDVTIFFGAPQMEQSPIATPYIPTSGSVATRSADQLTFNTADFGGLLGGATSGMAFVDLMLQTISPTIADAFYIGDGTTNNYLISVANNTAGYVTGYCSLGGSTYNTAGTIGPASAGAWYRAGLIWAPWLGGYYVGMNGATPTQGTPPSLPPYSQAMLGNRPFDNARPLNGYMRQVALYPFAASLATFQTLSIYGAQLP